MSFCIIDGKKIAEKINSVTRKLIQGYAARTGRSPSLHLVQIGEDKASARYLAKKTKLGEELGIRVESHTFPSSLSQEDAAGKIRTLSDIADTDAVLLQLPLPVSLNEEKLLDLIPQYKDVDGITSSSLGTLLRLRIDGFERFEDGLYKALLPCTPAGVLYLIEETCRELKGSASLRGMNVLVIGRSALEGASTALLLQAADATVSVAHSGTEAEDLKDLSMKADIIVSACGVPGFVTASMIREGSILIDVGLTWVEGKGLLGDIDFEGCSKKSAAITPVPGGVGPMILAMLMRNVLICAEKNTSLQVNY